MKREIKKYIENKDIDNICEILKKGNQLELKEFCINIGIKILPEDQESEIYYKIMEKIEETDELFEHFLDISKREKVFRNLFPYCQNVKHIRYIVDNKDEFELSSSEINKMEKFLHERYNKKYEKQEKEINKRTLNLMPIIIIVLFVLLIGLISPFWKIYVKGSAIISEANIIEKYDRMSVLDVIYTESHIKYNYIVDNQTYENEEDVTLIGFMPVELFDNKDKCQIYYYKDNPSDAHIFQDNVLVYNRVIICLAIVVEIIFIIAFIKNILERRKIKNNLPKNL